MKILIITGRRAESAVRDAVGNAADVVVADVGIAAFITPHHLKHLDLSGYHLVLVPGLVSSDFSALEKERGVPIRRGPKHAVDLGFVLEFAESVEFSPTVPACELLASKRREKAFEKLSLIEATAKEAFSISGVKIGGGSRMKVMAEVVGADTLPASELEKTIRLFIHEGADIIDLGMSLEASVREAIAAIKTAKQVCRVPISIDTLDTDLLTAALGCGVDLLLSLNSENMKAVAPLATSTPCVVIPDCEGGIESLEENIAAARAYGVKYIIADPVLDPVNHGIAESIVRYSEFHRRHPDTPLFFGAGNVSELMDVDSVGVNGLLAGIASEVGASILFTPEYSDKNRGSIRELKTASQMMLLSRSRKTPPKDLGIDLLILKEKRRRPFDTLPSEFIPAAAPKSWELDPAGCVKISITETAPQRSAVREGMILAAHREGVVAGRHASEILNTLIERGFISTLSHAAYLGRELMRAEMALRFNRSYAQDDEF
jgi:dihydropteroate synthase-like protein